MARDGVLTEAALRAKLEGLGYTVSCYLYHPGTSFPDHTHGMDKIDAVLSGTLRITTAEGAVDLGPGDSVYVPAGAVHSAKVIGNTPVLSLDAVKVR